MTDGADRNASIAGASDRAHRGVFRDGDRAVSSVVGKSMELGILALYVGLLVTAVYGGVLPDYRAGAGSAVADRTAAAVATDVESAVPATGEGSGEIVAVDAERTLDVPRTIHGETYDLRLVDGDLVLDHEADALSRRIPLSLPDAVVSVTGEAASGDTVVLVVESTSSGLVVRLEGR